MKVKLEWQDGESLTIEAAQANALAELATNDERANAIVSKITIMDNFNSETHRSFLRCVSKAHRFLSAMTGHGGDLVIHKTDTAITFAAPSTTKVAIIFAWRLLNTALRCQLPSRPKLKETPFSKETWDRVSIQIDPNAIQRREPEVIVVTDNAIMDNEEDSV